MDRKTKPLQARERPMNILYLTLENLSLQKGSVVHVKEVVTGLRQRGHRVSLAALSWNNVEIADRFHNLRWYTFFRQRNSAHIRQSYFVSSFLLFFLLFRILRRHDLIYARDFHTALIALLPRLLFRKKLVLEVNGLAHEEQRLKRDSLCNRILVFLIEKAEKAAVRWSDRVISVTPQLASFFIHHSRCHGEKVNVVSNGVHTGRFRPVCEEETIKDLKGRWGIDEKDTVIAFVGNLAPWQGVDVLIESATDLLSRNEDVKFLIVGDGFLRASLINRVTDRGLERRFVFTGMVDYTEIPFLINIADICVAPFIRRRNIMTGVSPLKVLEYMACGKPVVSTRIEGLEFIEEQGAGRLIQPGDVKGLAEVLGDLIQKPEKRREMGQKGLQIAREKFDWRLKVAEVEVILRELV